MRRLVFFLVDKRVVVVVVVSMLYTFVSRLCSSYTDVNVLTRRCRIPSTLSQCFQDGVPSSRIGLLCIDHHPVA